ncbi:hypothetical protein [Gloeobacter morelensis]|uniref:hypothetical protein n=1 Tax=Gloeobacter morelensis TaxID=2907343 RepID=UPI001E4D3031|nr:hypothetical protein [Gloeobacter morelensis]UFP97202.1 hypothetical protein ISF26_24075 [Gloeobacter morelensis MG652769]
MNLIVDKKDPLLNRAAPGIQGAAILKRYPLRDVMACRTPTPYGSRCLQLLRALASCAPATAGAISEKSVLFTNSGESLGSTVRLLSELKSAGYVVVTAKGRPSKRRQSEGVQLWALTERGEKAAQQSQDIFPTNLGLSRYRL